MSLHSVTQVPHANAVVIFIDIPPSHTHTHTRAAPERLRDACRKQKAVLFRGDPKRRPRCDPRSARPSVKPFKESGGLAASSTERCWR